MGKDNGFPPVIFAADGWIMAMEPPVTAQDLCDKVVGSYAGTRGALGWSIGDHEVYHCELESGERYGEADHEGLDASTYSFVHSATPGAELRKAQNLQALIASDGGPLTVLAGACRERALPFFPRVRYGVDAVYTDARGMPPSSGPCLCATSSSRSNTLWDAASTAGTSTRISGCTSTPLPEQMTGVSRG